jgi:hypothetical protein
MKNKTIKMHKNPKFCPPASFSPSFCSCAMAMARSLSLETDVGAMLEKLEMSTRDEKGIFKITFKILYSSYNIIHL